MSLKSYFPEQLDKIKEFIISGKEIVRIVRIDSEMKPMLTKALAKLEDDPDFPHALLKHTGSFETPVQYFNDLLDLAKNDYKNNAEELALRGVKFETPYPKDSLLKSPAKFVLYACALADNLPDSMGSLVFILEPENVNNNSDYKKSIEYLSKKTTSRWIKYLVLDNRLDLLLEGVEENNKKIGVQTFYLSPEEIERRAEQDLRAPGALSPLERRQHIGLLAGFAFAKKDYDKAAKLQTQWLKEAEQNGEPSEVATAYYNLGNTLLEKQSYPEATDAYCKACEICTKHQLNALAPYVYTNLGISLHRQGSFEPAFASLKVARDMFKAQNHRPSEAHVVDCLAQMYAMDKKNEEAEKAWLYALSIYDSITSSSFSDLRESGRNDIITKLERFYDETGQSDKKSALHDTKVTSS